MQFIRIPVNDLVWFLLLNKIYEKLEGGMEQYLVLVVPTFLKCINLQISHNFFPLILTICITCAGTQQYANLTRLIRTTERGTGKGDVVKGKGGRKRERGTSYVAPVKRER